MQKILRPVRAAANAAFIRNDFLVHSSSRKRQEKNSRPFEDFKHLLQRENFGSDPSCQFLFKRLKSIAYLTNFGDQWTKLNFSQTGSRVRFSNDANVLSNGLVQSEYFLENLDQYKEIFDVKEGTPILCQISQSLLYDRKVKDIKGRCSQNLLVKSLVELDFSFKF